MANPTTYPDSFPSKEITTVVSYLRGAGGDPKAVLFDAYVVTGYALGVVAGNPAAAKAQPAPPPLNTNEEKAAALEGLLPKQGARAGVTLPAWLLPLMLTVIQDVLKAILGG